MKGNLPQKENKKNQSEINPKENNAFSKTCSFVFHAIFEATTLVMRKLYMDAEILICARIKLQLKTQI